MNNPRKKECIFFIAIFGPLFISYFFPVIFHLSSRTFGYFGDKMGVIRALEWDQPIFLNQPILLVFVLLLSKLVSPFTVYNTVVLLSFPLTCYFAYKFFRRFFEPSLAFILALVFTFCPYHLYKIYNHICLSQIWLIPFYFSALLDFDSEASSRNALKLGGSLVLTTLVSNYYGYFAVLSSACLLIIRAIQSLLSKKVYFTKKRIGVLSLIVFACLTFITPFLYLFLKDLSYQDVKVVNSHPLTNFVAFSARPWYFVTPPVDHQFFGRLARNIHDWFSGSGYFLFDDFFWEEHSAIFLGWTNLVFASLCIIYYVLRGRRQPAKEKSQALRLRQEPDSGELAGFGFIRLFFWLAIFLVILSGPPFFTLFGFRIYLPSYILMKCFPIFRTLARLGVSILLCVLVLAGYSIEFLKQRFKMKQTVYYLLITVYCLLNLSEFYFPLDIAPVPERDSRGYQLLLERYPLYMFENQEEQ